MAAQTAMALGAKNAAGTSAKLNAEKIFLWCWTVMDYTESTYDTCWLCGRNGSADPLDKHHIFRGPNRSKSEKYGLVVRLCHSRCHLYGKYAVHNNSDTMAALHQFGQRKAMAENGWTADDFIREFGRNYIDAEDNNG